MLRQNRASEQVNRSLGVSYLTLTIGHINGNSKLCQNATFDSSLSTLSSIGTLLSRVSTSAPYCHGSSTCPATEGAQNFFYEFKAVTILNRANLGEPNLVTILNGANLALAKSSLDPPPGA